MGIVKDFLARFKSKTSFFKINVDKFLRRMAVRKISPWQRKRKIGHKEQLIKCGFRNKSLVRIFSRDLPQGEPYADSKPFYIGKRTYVRFSDGSIRRASGIKMPEKRKLVAV